MSATEFPTSEFLIANAARFLIEGHEHDAASLLLSCECTIVNEQRQLSDEYDNYYWDDTGRVDFSARCPRPSYDILYREDSHLRLAVIHAIQAVLPLGYEIGKFECRAFVSEIDQSWKAELEQLARGKLIHNQGNQIKNNPIRIWNNLNFRSQSEIRIASALDDEGALYLPNCRARLNSSTGRVNREPDFLICHDGRWGILEVDGEAFHAPERADEHHAQDRLFRSHGIKVIERYPASRCYEEPGFVVKEFLSLLSKH